MPEEVVIHDADIRGRIVKIKEPTETQAILFGRASKRAQIAAKQEKLDEALLSMVEALDIIDYMIVEDDDRDYITELMKQGKIEAHELLDAIGDSIPKSAPKTGPAPRVTRGKSRS